MEDEAAVRSAGGNRSPSGDRDRIETHPGVLLGKPVVRGTRIPVTLILNLIANGYSVARIVQAYPLLEEADVRAAVAYAQSRLEEDDIAAPAVG